MSAFTITATSSASFSLLTYRVSTMSPWSLVASLIPWESITGCGIPVNLSIYSQSFFQDSSDTGELLWVVFNYAACVPVLLLVGGFRYLSSHRFPTGQANKVIQPLPLLHSPREHYHYRSMGEGQSGDSYSAGQDSRSQVPICS